MATIRPLAADEIETLVEDIWIPFAKEMGDVSEWDALAEAGVRENVLSHRREQFENEDRATFVAVVDGELIGYVSVEHRPSPPVFARGDAGYVHGLYVVPEHRGLGLASDLFDRAREWASERGCTHLSLDVHPENEPARSVYREWGFEPRRERLVRPLK